MVTFQPWQTLWLPSDSSSPCLGHIKSSPYSDLPHGNWRPTGLAPYPAKSCQSIILIDHSGPWLTMMCLNLWWPLISSDWCIRLTKAVLLQLSALEARANSLNHRVSDFIELQSMVFHGLSICSMSFHVPYPSGSALQIREFTVHYGLLWFTTQRSACQGKLSWQFWLPIRTVKSCEITRILHDSWSFAMSVPRKSSAMIGIERPQIQTWGHDLWGPSSVISIDHSHFASLISYDIIDHSTIVTIGTN